MASEKILHDWFAFTISPGRTDAPIFYHDRSARESAVHVVFHGRRRETVSNIHCVFSRDHRVVADDRYDATEPIYKKNNHPRNAEVSAKSKKVFYGFTSTTEMRSIGTRFAAVSHSCGCTTFWSNRTRASMNCHKYRFAHRKSTVEPIQWSTSPISKRFTSKVYHKFCV